MKILMLNWRDLKNPRSGGAEVVTEEVIKRLVTRGHEVTLFTTIFEGAAAEEVVDGYKIIRQGRETTVHLWAFYYWMKYFSKENFDIVVDQIHGVPFFTPLYIRSTTTVAFIHEVAKEIWLRMYAFPIGRIGYMLEPIFFWFYKKTSFITVSHATKRDLQSVGILEKNIDIIPEAITTETLPNIPDKTGDPTILFVGRVAKMKGVDDLIAAYLIARATIPNLKLSIVGGGSDYKAELEAKYSSDPGITFHGFVSEEEKNALYARAHILSSASMKEGFGLVVIEAAAHGTPSVVYNVDGFNEAVIDGQTGLLTDTAPEALAAGLTTAFTDTSLYTTLQAAAHEHSKIFDFDRTTDAFENIIQKTG